MPTKEILVLEDEPNWRCDIKELLDKAGYSVRVASTLTEAVGGAEGWEHQSGCS